MVLFEEPRDVGAPFGGTHGTRSAIVAAAGEFVLTRAGASVTTSRPSATELRVSWHAPLFNSAVLSDVSVVLAEQGDVTIEWSRLDLSDGGSLTHGLIVLLTHDSVTTSLLDGDRIASAYGQDATVVCAQGHGALVAPGEQPFNTTMAAVFGADPGKGLDLRGEFVYALDIGGDGGMVIGDAVFTPVDVDGVTLQSNGAPTHSSPIGGVDNMGDYHGLTASSQLGGSVNGFVPVSADDRSLKELWDTIAITFFGNADHFCISLSV